MISVGEADLALLRSVKSRAALDFFRYHPITGLCRDCPAELRESLAQMSEKSNRLKPLVRVKGFDFTREAGIGLVSRPEGVNIGSADETIRR